MPKGSNISWKEFEKFLLYVGCHFKRERGDHRVYRRNGIHRSLVVPRYNPVPAFIIQNNLRILGISWKEFLEILEKI